MNELFETVRLLVCAMDLSVSRSTLMIVDSLYQACSPHSSRRPDFCCCMIRIIRGSFRCAVNVLYD
jgi:hypothetical protein